MEPNLQVNIDIFDPFRYVDELVMQYKDKKIRAKIKEKFQENITVMPDENDNILYQMRKCLKKILYSLEPISNNHIFEVRKL